MLSSFCSRASIPTMNPSHIFLFYRFRREQHLEKKIEQLTAEAKAKMAKKDKKGGWTKLSRMGSGSKPEHFFI